MFSNEHPSGHLSLAHNPALLSSEEHTALSVYADQQWMLKELTVKGIGFSKCFKPYALGLIMHHQGDRRFQILTLDMVGSHRLTPHFSWGVKLRFQHMTFSDIYGSRWIFYGLIGSHCRPNERWSFSCYLENPSRQILLSELDERLAWMVHLGTKYRFHNRLKGHLDMSYGSSEQLTLKFGLSCLLTEQFCLMIRYAELNSEYQVGLSFWYKGLQIEQSISYDIDRGITPAIQLIHAFDK